MSKKVKQLGSIVFYKPLFIKEFSEPDNVVGEMVMSANGTHIAYSAPINTPYVTLQTLGNSGWLDEDNVSALKLLWVALDTTYTIIYDDDSTDIVRFAHEKKPSYLPISVGACYYNVTIPLAKV